VKRVIASFQTWRKTGARCAHQVRNAEEVIPHAEVQSEIGRNPPIILSEEADFVLMPVADPSKNLRVLRMEICVAKIEEARIGRLANLEPFADASDRSGERQQKILGKRSAIRKQAGDSVNALHRNIACAAEDRRNDVLRRPRE